ncbi:hypothetical protein SD71_13160 [Cohnella kolymensis]|uniref:Citrate transporter-like domain-containing protein n=2 Tax=Cohnella kolymensis TaxID=1590652 RepID=A0ABR5A3E5_9BACL|nr:hypothetical protein SD71_13160 [Cohnella kolymensis]
MLVIVSLVSILFPLFWAIFNKGWHHMIPHLANYRDHSVPIFNNEIVLIISAGLLGNSIQDTSIGNGIKSVLNNLETYSFFLFAIVVVALVVSVTFAGIPPLVIVTALATQMNAQELDTSNTVLAMLLLLAWSISSVLSPMNPLNLLVSRLSGISGFEAGLRANGVHLLIVAVVGSLIITMIH